MLISIGGMRRAVLVPKGIEFLGPSIIERSDV